MSTMTCKLFGVPQILKDGQPVFLPYSKINALLYYILVSKVVSREELAGLLWPDETDETARRNLRNAIYQAKKALGTNIILSPKKSLLMLNENLDLTLDIDQFLQAPQENLHLYTGEFLQGFFLKGAETYEYWIVKMRNYYKEKFFSECYQKVADDLDARRYDQVETHIRYLMELDEYDERAFRLLLRFYQETGRNGKVIKSYYEFAKLLRRELGVAPDQTTKEIYERALEQMHFETGRSVSNDESFFFGRYQEIAALEKALKEFKENPEGGRSILICGEPGSGRSTMKRRALDGVEEHFYILQTQGLSMGQDLSLRPWRQIAREIAQLLQEEPCIPPSLWHDLMSRVFPDFQEHLPSTEFLTTPEKVPIGKLAHVMVEAIHTLYARKRVLLVVENLQWLDPDSLRLLTTVMLELSPSQAILLATCTLARNRPLDDALSALQYHSPMLILTLRRFTVEACHSLIKKALPPSQAGNGELLEQIYNETEGNPFLLNEYIAMLQRGESLDHSSPAIQSFLRTQLLGLSQEALELAEVLSCFYDGAPLSSAAQILGKNASDLLAPLEQLENRGVFLKHTGSQEAIHFAHPKLREYIYNAQPVCRRASRHLAIGQLLEEQLRQSRHKNRVYPLLIFHFSQAGYQLEAMKYKIANLNSRLNFSHEIFPVFNEEDMDLDLDPVPYVSRDRIDALFQNLETDIRAFRAAHSGSKELELLEMQFFYLKGRYPILEGRYEEGVGNITWVIETSRRLGRVDYTLAGYKQLIFYFIQIDDADGMKQNLDLALDLAVQENNHREIGVLLRLQGLYHMMTGNYEQAEKRLLESINALTVTESMARSYTVNIAASYNYIGEILMEKEDYVQALPMFSKAISLCPGNVFSSLSVFYINAGKASFFQRDYAAAQAFLEKALALYGQFDSFWRRPTLNSYLALTLVENRNLPAARRHLLAAQKYMWQMKNPSDQGSVFFSQALIRTLADREPDVGRFFDEILPDSALDYGRLALKHLSRWLDRPEINSLRRLFPEL